LLLLQNHFVMIRVIHAKKWVGTSGTLRFETLRIIATQGKNATVIVPDRIDPAEALRVTGSNPS